MNQRELEELLKMVASGDVTAEEASLRLRLAPFTDLGFAKVDHHRGIRQGAAEVVYGAGKTPDQIASIVADMLGMGQRCVIVTRISPDAAREVEQGLSEGITFATDDASESENIADEEGIAGALPLFTYYDLPQLAVIGEMPEPDGKGTIVVACGGTSDIYVAEEAALTAEAMGNDVVRLYDVGVAGLHRLLAYGEQLAQARVVVAVAGMEGALASVIGGLVSCPVIAVPTSVGYGASLGGVSALLSMLNSCASGVSVVNIDNGFGAGYQASLINHL